MFSPSLRKSVRIQDKYQIGKKTYNHKPNNKPGNMFPKHPMIKNDDDDDDEEGGGGMPFKFPRLFGGEHHDVYTVRNHIYFKTDVSRESIDKLATEIENLNNKMETMKRKNSLGTFEPKPIYLHITTNGGDLLAGFFGYDKIKASRVKINTIIEGGVASAGSLLSIAGETRYMTPHSHLLIHQLRTGIIGTYEELVDEKNNCVQFMDKLVNIYFENCNGKMSKSKIKEVLKRDIFWNTDTSLANGFVDEVWNGDIE